MLKMSYKLNLQARKGQSVPSPSSSDTTKEQGSISPVPVDVTSSSDKFDITKAQKEQSSATTKEQSGIPAAPVDLTTPSDEVDLDLVAENDGRDSSSSNQANKEQQLIDTTSSLLETPSTEKLTDDGDKHEMVNVEVLASDTNAKPSTISATDSTNMQLALDNASEIQAGHPPPFSKRIEGPSENQPADAGAVINPGNLDADLKKDQAKSESVTSETAPNSDTVPKDTDLKVESINNGKSQEDHKTDSSKKVENQLDEVTYLLLDRCL